MLERLYKHIFEHKLYFIFLCFVEFPMEHHGGKLRLVVKIYVRNTLFLPKPPIKHHGGKFMLNLKTWILTFCFVWNPHSARWWESEHWVCSVFVCYNFFSDSRLIPKKHQIFIHWDSVFLTWPGPCQKLKHKMKLNLGIKTQGLCNSTRHRFFFTRKAFTRYYQNF